MLPWIQKQRYLEDKEALPKEFDPESEAGLQWTYNPRTKKSREYFEEFCRDAKIERKQTVRANSKQKGKGRKKKSY